jgi:hypothetical protein
METSIKDTNRSKWRAGAAKRGRGGRGSHTRPPGSRAGTAQQVPAGLDNYDR